MVSAADEAPISWPNLRRDRRTGTVQEVYSHRHPTTTLD